MSKITFRGMPGLSSGYGRATLYFAKAFFKSGLDVNFNFHPSGHYEKVVKEKVELEHPEFKDFKMYDGSKSDIFFYLGTPKLPDKDKFKYKIIYFYWETDTLPRSWIKLICEYDEAWVPCKLTESALRKTEFPGVIRVVPTINSEFEDPEEFFIPHNKKSNSIVSDGVFKFYYIFQWHYRKGYDKLIKAYVDAFDESDNVLLVLKTSRISSSQEKFETLIKEEISNLKSSSTRPPPIFVIPNNIKSGKISYLHKCCDVYVAPHRGEGWGMPIAQAAMEKNAIITTNFGGAAEFLGNDSAYLIDYDLVPVSNMSWSGNLYTSDQKWAEPKHESLVDAMRRAYADRDKNKKKGNRAFNVFKHFSVEKLSVFLKEEFSSRRFLK